MSGVFLNKLSFFFANGRKRRYFKQIKSLLTGFLKICSNGKNRFSNLKVLLDEADFISHFQQQTVSLLEHISSIWKHNTLQGFPDFVFSLIGYFVSLIRTTQISPELAENVPNLANQAALQVHEKVEKILERAEKDFTSEPKSESLILAVCELINLFQYYGIQNSALDACMNKLFGDFCRDYVDIQVEKIIEGLNKNRTEISDQTEPSVKVNLREVFDKLEKPRFSSNALNSGSLEKAWNDHRERFFDLFMENYLRNALDVVIPREDENTIRKLITMLSKYKSKFFQLFQFFSRRLFCFSHFTTWKITMALSVFVSGRF